MQKTRAIQARSTSVCERGCAYPVCADYNAQTLVCTYYIFFSSRSIHTLPPDLTLSCSGLAVGRFHHVVVDYRELGLLQSGTAETAETTETALNRRKNYGN